MRRRCSPTHHTPCLPGLLSATHIDIHRDSSKSHTCTWPLAEWCLLAVAPCRDHGARYSPLRFGRVWRPGLWRKSVHSLAPRQVHVPRPGRSLPLPPPKVQEQVHVQVEPPREDSKPTELAFESQAPQRLSAEKPPSHMERVMSTENLNQMRHTVNSGAAHTIRPTRQMETVAASRKPPVMTVVGRNEADDEDAAREAIRDLLDEQSGSSSAKVGGQKAVANSLHPFPQSSRVAQAAIAHGEVSTRAASFQSRGTHRERQSDSIEDYHPLSRSQGHQQMRAPSLQERETFLTIYQRQEEALAQKLAMFHERAENPGQYYTPDNDNRFSDGLRSLSA